MVAAGAVSAGGMVLAVGMGLPAPIGGDGLVVPSSILPGWVGVKAVDVASERLERPVKCPIIPDQTEGLAKLAAEVALW